MQGPRISKESWMLLLPCYHVTSYNSTSGTEFLDFGLIWEMQVSRMS